MLDTSNEHMSLVLHDALSVDLDLPAIQSLFYLLSLQPKVLLQFFKHTATSDIYLNAGMNAVSSISPFFELSPFF